MRISKTSLIIIGVISLIMCSCEPIHKYFLTDDELQWLKAYNKNDTILFFCDSTNDLDTLIVTSRKINNPKNHNPFDWEDKSLIAMMLETSNEICGWGHIDYKLLHNNKKYDGAVLMCKQKKTGYADFSIYFRYGINWDNQLRTNKIGQFYFPVPDQLYLNRDSNKTVSGQKWNDIKELTWDKHTGLETYSFGDSVYYRLNVFPAKQSGKMSGYN